MNCVNNHMLITEHDNTQKKKNTKYDFYYICNNKNCTGYGY